MIGGWADEILEKFGKKCIWIPVFFCIGIRRDIDISQGYDANAIWI